ncbi:MAG: prepilin-type N-terminal cleavage/methylation domain-containing protein [Verrucomicrobia bacterium]|nr:prepilin-type N-terminal cleavage/methylation domain-containing protein [Verrucomicrobiota bacterium]
MPTRQRPTRRRCFVEEAGAGREPAFTLIELLVVFGIVALLAALLLPALARAKHQARTAACLSNAKQWGLAFLMHTEDNDGIVPEEGNTLAPIAHPQNRVAWYETVPPSLALEPLTALYAAGAPPMPGVPSLFACPEAPRPDFSPDAHGKAYFMYGMNGRLCINKGGATRRVPNTRLSSVLRPADTIFIAEVNGNYPAAGRSQSNVTGRYAIGRHAGRGVFAMTDGAARLIATNEFRRTPTEANRAAAEWRIERSVYWYPSPFTPNGP